MARNRMIKPEFWEDDKIASLNFQTRLFYIALWNFADDEGYVEIRENWLKAKCFPYDDADIRRMIDELSTIGRTESSNGILKIKSFLRHQRIDRPKISGLKDIFDEPSTNDRRALDESSTTKRKGREEKLKEVEGTPASPAATMEIRKTLRLPDSFPEEQIIAVLGKYPKVDVAAVALKVAGKYIGKPYGQLWTVFVNWCGTEKPKETEKKDPYANFPKI